MKILFVTGVSPWPPTIGNRLRSYNIARLLTRYHEVSAALFHDSPEEIAHFQNDPARFLTTHVVPAAAPAHRRRWRSSPLERFRLAFRSETRGLYRDGLMHVIERERPDLLWFFRLDTVWQSGWETSELPVVCDVDDFESKAHKRAIRFLSTTRRVVASLDYPFFVRAQRHAARACDLLLVSNPDDVAEAGALTGRPVRVAPNGYDYSIEPDFEREREQRIVFFGSLRYRPNADGLLWFMSHVWPQIREALPEVRLDIAGPTSPAVEYLANEPGVRLCGFVESIRSFASGAALLIVPLRMGGGTRIKILEAWGLGLPVVSTTVGCEGLQAVDGETLLVADDADAFARACIELVRKPDHGAQMARRAFDFAKPRYDWLALAPGLENALDWAIRARGGGGLGLTSGPGVGAEG